MAIRQHHERMDGSGYPQGLKGNDIILEARILAVAEHPTRALVAIGIAQLSAASFHKSATPSTPDYFPGNSWKSLRIRVLEAPAGTYPQTCAQKL